MFVHELLCTRGATLMHRANAYTGNSRVAKLHCTCWIPLSTTRNIESEGERERRRERVVVLLYKTDKMHTALTID